MRIITIFYFFLRYNKHFVAVKGMLAAIHRKSSNTKVKAKIQDGFGRDSVKKIFPHVYMQKSYFIDLVMKLKMEML